MGKREAPKVRLEGRASLLCFLFLQLDISGKLYLAPLTTVVPMWGGLGGGSVVIPTVPSALVSGLERVSGVPACHTLKCMCPPLFPVWEPALPEDL